MMAIRKRSALLLGVFGFLSGVVFAQYRRKAIPPLHRPEKLICEEKKAFPPVPMQVMAEPLATARRKKTSEEQTSELQSLMHLAYAVFCLTKKTRYKKQTTNN